MLTFGQGKILSPRIVKTVTRAVPKLESTVVHSGVQPLLLANGLALIFDLDGVIVNSMPVHELSWARYLDSIGLQVPDMIQRMHGRRNDQIFRDFLGPDPSDQEIHAHGSAKEQLFRDMIQPQLSNYIVPGVIDLLQRTQHIPVGLASNAERPNVDFVLDQAGVRRHFQVIVDGARVDHPKPAPDVYLRAAELLNTEPRNCIVFEDSPVGVAAARAAGARVVGIQTQTQFLADVELAIPDFRAPQLMEYLEQQGKR